MKRMWTRVTAGMLVLGIWSVSTGSGLGQDPKTNPMPTVTFDKSGAIVVTIGGQSRFQMKSGKRIREAFNENDRVVQVLADATDPMKIILVGRAAGTSRLEMTDVDGGKESYLIVVQRDMELLRNLIRKTVPTASVEVTPIGDNGTNIIVSGYAAREDDRDVIRQLAEALGLRVAVNNVQVGGGGLVPHVQLDLTLAKVDRTRARSRGASWIFNGSTVSGGSLLGGLASLQQGGGAAATGTATVGLSPTAGTVIPTATANLIGGIVPSNFALMMAALRNEGLAKLVSAPSVVSRSGEEASLLVGGRVPVISAAAGITGPGVTYENVGTELRFLPIVYGNGKVHLTVSPAVRSVSTAQALTTSFGVSPAFEEQRLTTSVVVEPGQTLAIGGLIQTSVQGSVNKIPYLGDIPLLGAFFSYATQQEQEIELVILITPHLVDPADPSQMPRPLPGSETRKPDDFEFFLETMLEAPRGCRNLFEGHHYKAAWKSSHTSGTYPCCPTPGCNLLNKGTSGGAGCDTGACPPGGAGMVKPGSSSISSTLPVERNAIGLPPASLDAPIGGADLSKSGTAVVPVDPIPTGPASILAPSIPGSSPTASRPLR